MMKPSLKQDIQEQIDEVNKEIRILEKMIKLQPINDRAVRKNQVRKLKTTLRLFQDILNGQN